MQRIGVTKNFYGNVDAVVEKHTLALMVQMMPMALFDLKKVNNISIPPR